MNIDIQRSNDRGRTSNTWLLSRHSFSFGNYLDPARMGFGLLRVLNDDTIEPGGGFPTHHHDNMEIVTIVLEGALQHKDSSGGESLLKKEEVQVMSAGRGIYHSEFNASKGRLHILQIWIDTAMGDINPRYGQKKVRKSMTMPIVGKTGLHINQDAQFYMDDLTKGSKTEHEVDPGKGAYVFVIKGEIKVGNQSFGPGDAAGITDTKSFKIYAVEESEMLVIDVPME